MCGFPPLQILSDMFKDLINTHVPLIVLENKVLSREVTFDTESLCRPQRQNKRDILFSWFSVQDRVQKLKSARETLSFYPITKKRGAYRQILIMFSHIQFSLHFKARRLRRVQVTSSQREKSWILPLSVYVTLDSYKKSELFNQTLFTELSLCRHGLYSVRKEGSGHLCGKLSLHRIKCFEQFLSCHIQTDGQGKRKCKAYLFICLFREIKMYACLCARLRIELIFICNLLIC